MRSLLFLYVDKRGNNKVDEQNAKKYLEERLVREKAEGFLDFYNKYYMGDAPDETVTDYTTQAYYHSMTMAKKRLEQNGLQMGTSIEPVYSDDMEKMEQGNVTAVSNCRRTKVTREFFSKGKRIFKEKNHEVIQVNYLKSDVDGSAECPNCGFVGKVSSFIDGCDQCGSKFEVKEFEPKVSAFTIHLDTEKYADRITKIVQAVAVILSVMMFALSFIGMMVAPGDLQVNGGGDKVLGSIYVSLGVYMAEPFVRFAILMWFILFFLGVLFTNKYGQSITGKDVIEDIIKDFMVPDFAQNLEMRLKQIYLTDKEQYLDIVEAQMSALHFLEARKLIGYYEIKARARMHLYHYVNDKIKRSAEEVTVTVRLSKEPKSMTFIKAYRCKGCGSTIDIMKGGACEHCGHQLSLDEIGMQIVSTEFARAKQSLVALYVKQSILVFLLCLVVNMFIPCLLSMGKMPIWMATQICNVPKEVNRFFDLVPPVETVVADASQIVAQNVIKNSTTRECVYTLKDGKAALEAYKERMSQRGYQIASESDSYFEARQEVEYFTGEGNVLVKFYLSGDELKIHYEIE